MAVIEVMPKFGLSMEEGIVGEWLVQPGATVKRGDALAVIEAEKLVNNAVASRDGVVLKLYLETGDAAPCGSPLCAIGDAGEAAPDASGDAPAAEEATAPAAAPAAASSNATIEVMPKFGLSMEEGIVGEWLVKEGANVKRGDALAVIEAEKLTNNAVASRDGVVLKLYLGEGDSAPCGSPLCAIGEEGDAVPAVPGEAPAVEATPAPAAAPAAAPVAVQAAMTPRAAAAAAAHGVNVAGVKGTGKDGEITVDDVRYAASHPAAAPAGPVAITPRAKLLAGKLGLSYDHIVGTGLLGMVTVSDLKAHGRPIQLQDEIIPMNGIQRATAAAMKASLENSAQAVVTVEETYGPMVKAYKRLKPIYAEKGLKLSYTAMIIKAVALAIKDRPDIRMQYADASHFRLPAAIHIGVAVDTPKGLVVPVVRNADVKSLGEICKDLSELSAKANSGRLTGEDMGNAVTTVTNLAMANVTAFTPILNPPESTILGICKLREVPVVKNGGIFIEPVMNLCLTYDHRVINGAPAGRFVSEIANLLNTIDWQ